MGLKVCRPLRELFPSPTDRPSQCETATEYGSIGFCSIGTAVMVHPDGTLYAQVQPADVAEIVEQHIEKGIVVIGLALMKL